MQSAEKPALTSRQAISELRSLGSQRNREGMARFGINVESAFGVSVVQIRKLGKRCGKSHALAAELWLSGFHEARILATVVDIPTEVTSGQMDRWVRDFNSWDLCDQCCANLFDKTPHAWAKVAQWSRREKEFEKRAAFALIASLARHDRIAPEQMFLELLPLIERHSTDDRNFVRKSVNWALRSIGKRSDLLRAEAILCAERILDGGTRSGLWIARDALRDLRKKGRRE